MAFYKISNRTVEAFRWTGDAHQTEHPLWMEELVAQHAVTYDWNPARQCGEMHYDGGPEGGRFIARVGSWIIRYGNGIISYRSDEDFREQAHPIPDPNGKPTLKLSDEARARVKEEIEVIEMMGNDNEGMEREDLQVLLDLHDQVHGLTDK